MEVSLYMHEFLIRLSNMDEIKQFVQLATVQPFEVSVCTDWQSVNAKSFMGMFSLDLENPLHVKMQCNDAEFEEFRSLSGAFLSCP